MVYIYGLQCPIAGVIRYIGKTTDPKSRMRAHIGVARRGSGYRSSRWIRKVLEAGLKPQMVILEEVADSNWESAERRHIAEAKTRGLPLTNITSGGESIEFNDEVRSRMRAAQRRRFSDVAEREKFMVSMRDPERTEKLSAAMKRRMQDQQYRSLLLGARAKAAATLKETWRRRKAAMTSAETDSFHKNRVSAAKAGWETRRKDAK